MTIYPESSIFSLLSPIGNLQSPQSRQKRGEKANTLRYLLPDWLFDYNSDD
jgi:hypothetical protein